MNRDILNDISAGMYILTTKNTGCFVDAVMQISMGSSPCIAVSVMKDNYTNKIMHKQTNFAISIFGMDNDTKLIKTFGMKSSKDIDKFEGLDLLNINGINVIKDSIGYIYLEKIDTIETETHTLFIGRVIDKERFNDSKLMTYQYYQEHKDELLKVKSETGKTAWVCEMCGYVYYGEKIEDDYICPICKMSGSVFKKVTK